MATPAEAPKRAYRSRASLGKAGQGLFITGKATVTEGKERQEFQTRFDAMGRRYVRQRYLRKRAKLNKSRKTVISRIKFLNGLEEQSRS